MKKLLLLIAIFCAIKVSAQNITFSGTGLSTVKVENLTKTISVTLNSDDILTLSSTVDIRNAENGKISGIKIYPNPMREKSNLVIFSPVPGHVTISVFDINGRLLSQLKSYAENVTQEFSLSGFRSGLYLINVKGNSYQYSEKLICNGKSNGIIGIEKVRINSQAVGDKKSIAGSKGVQTTYYMLYNTGDILKITGTSGNNRTIIVDSPSTNKTITFTFTACTDGSGNNYPVVTIGTQTWMAENLKTTKYYTGTNIPLVTTAGNWYNNLATTKAYCWYDDNITNKDIYGALYTWAAAMNGAASSSASPSGIQGVCPTGWHLPSHAEWTTLTTYLGGESVAGSKLKETGTSHWNTPNTSADNSSGFTALPGGNRTMYGACENLGNNCGWWSSTEQATNYAYRRYLYYNSSDVNSSTANYKSYGYAVRCLKN
jgi:uncharacterized protein (TIGR02145 family)